MKRLAVAAALTLLALLPAFPASAAGNFIQDGAGLFAPGTVAQLNQEIGSFQAQTGKEIVVVTVPSLNGSTAEAAARAAFSAQSVNGVLVYIAKAEHQDWIVPGTTEVSSGWFPSATITSISQSMVAQFKGEDYDGGVTTAVNGILNVYRSHVSSLPNSGASGNGASNGYTYASHSHGGHGSFMWIVLLIVGFLVIRSIFRNMGGRNYGPMGGPGYGGPPMGGPGYGGGYGYGGGGGGFWSGMLGGLGGAFIGNELFGNHGGGGGFMDQGGMGGGQVGGGDSGAGWGNDAGQSGMGGGGDFGGGGFGDFGGGGGGDMGGGGGGW